jgi:hypothetical protein
MKNILKTVLTTIVAFGVFSSCVNDKEYEVPAASITTYDLVANKSVAQIITAPTGLMNAYADDDIIEAYVTSSDESGNFYNTICFQTIPVGNLAPAAFSVTVEVKAFVQGFTPGRKVYIKMKGLYSAVIDGSLKIGSLYQGQIGRISAFDWKKYLFPSASTVPESQLLRTLSLTQAAMNENLNSLIEIDNVQFSDDSTTRTLFDIDSGGLATNHNIVDIAGGRNRFLRVSSFSLLKGVMVPSGRGKIRGVMTKFGSDFQFIVRYESDLKLNNPRSFNYFSALNENFSSYPATGSFSVFTSTYSFANYINLTTQGTKKWFVKTGGFLEMSAFAGNVENNKTYFMVPVNMTAASNFGFKVSVGFFSNRLGLKIYRTTDYVPGMKIENATLVDISSSFPIPSANVTNLAVNYPIPDSVTGNGFFVFEYTGTSLTNGGPVVTTTIQLDDIVVN